MILRHKMIFSSRVFKIHTWRQWSFPGKYLCSVTYPHSAHCEHFKICIRRWYIVNTRNILTILPLVISLNLCWVDFCSLVLYLGRDSSAANDDDYSSVVYLIAKQIFVPIFLISSLRLWQKKVLNETKDRHHSELRGHAGQSGIFPQLSQN